MRLLLPISFELDFNVCLATCSNQGKARLYDNKLNRIEDDSMRKAGARP